jgi:para-aminobenzoate synthetase component I
MNDGDPAGSRPEREFVRCRVRGHFDRERVYETLIGDHDNSVWLDSGVGGRSYYAVGEPIDLSDGVLLALECELRTRGTAEGEGSALGIYGWFGFGVYGEVLGGPTGIYRDTSGSAGMLRVTRVVVVDDSGAELVSEGVRWSGENNRWRRETIDRLASIAGLGAMPAPETAHPSAPRWVDTETRYRSMIASCQAAITAGEVYQVCLTTQIDVEVDDRMRLFDLYRRVRASSQTHHGALLRCGGIALVSASPERFLHISADRTITTNPIKGTRPRGADPREDAAERASLLSSEKERAENLMIVDLMRNDLSKICAIGTVEVSRLFEVESYSHVHQLVSEIRGHLAPGVTVSDAIRACFPAGSMTGAPKQRAIEILRGLESRPRGPYAGAFGRIGLNGEVDLAMTIRTIMIKESGASIGAGGGITALSNVDDELNEVLIKAAPLLRALGCEVPNSFAGTASASEDKNLPLSQVASVALRSAESVSGR